MKVHTTPVVKVLPISQGGTIFNFKIEAWYDPHIRLWTATYNTEEGYQVGDTIYGTSKTEVESGIKDQFDIQ